MATPYIRAVVTPQVVISTASLSLTPPSDIAAGDLMILFAASPQSLPLTSEDWESIDRSESDLSGPYVQAWRRIADSREASRTVTVRVAKACPFLMALVVIADPGLAVTRLARMVETPHASIRTTDGFIIGAAYAMAPSGQGVQPVSNLRTPIFEGSNGTGLYASIRYGAAAVDTMVSHGLAQPTNYGTAAAGHLVDIVASAVPLGALVKGRATTGQDWELPG